MNCKLCKYREQVLGFEAEVGLAQESHHHHVEGIGTGAAGHHHHHDHDHHDHGHGHHHDHDHDHAHGRSEEHTSELQSLMRISYAVFCLKKKIKPRSTTHTTNQKHT